MYKRTIFQMLPLIVISGVLLAITIPISDFRTPSDVLIYTPTSIIKGRKSNLNRPEGIAFSPTSDCIAIANAHANSVCFYKRANSNDLVYESIPFFIINGSASRLKYPHDLSFSPDGRHLAVANRHGNRVTIYKKNPNDCYFNRKPIAVLKGAGSRIACPNAVKYAPAGNICAVANIEGNTVTFFSLSR